MKFLEKLSSKKVVGWATFIGGWVLAIWAITIVYGVAERSDMVPEPIAAVVDEVGDLYEDSVEPSLEAVGLRRPTVVEKGKRTALYIPKAVDKWTKRNISRSNWVRFPIIGVVACILIGLFGFILSKGGDLFNWVRSEGVERAHNLIKREGKRPTVSGVSGFEAVERGSLLIDPQDSKEAEGLDESDLESEEAGK